MEKSLKHRLSFNTRVFNFAFYGPTNSRGARIKVEDKYFDKKVFLPYDYATGNVVVQAAEYLKALGLEIAGMNDEYKILICREWNSHIQIATK